MNHQTGNLRDVFLFVLPYAALRHSVGLSFFSALLQTLGCLLCPFANLTPDFWQYCALCLLPTVSQPVEKAWGREQLRPARSSCHIFPDPSRSVLWDSWKVDWWRGHGGGSASRVGGVGRCWLHLPGHSWLACGRQPLSPRPIPPSQAPALSAVCKRI